ncbi:MAG TPA: hypothetical protein VI299_00085 [Polyangiales bacterium]
MSNGKRLLAALLASCVVIACGEGDDAPLPDESNAATSDAGFEQRADASARDAQLDSVSEDATDTAPTDAGARDARIDGAHQDVPDAAPPPKEPACGHDPHLPSPAELASYGLMGASTPEDEYCAELANVREDELDPSDKRKSWNGQDWGVAGLVFGFATQGVLCQANSLQWLDAAACAALFVYARQTVDITDAVSEAYRDDLKRGGPAGTNAVRHFAWLALVSAHFAGPDGHFDLAEEKARTLTALHEQVNLICNGTPDECRWDAESDVTHNELGIQFGFEIWKQDADTRRESIKARAMELLESGQFDLRGGCPSRYISIPDGC